jgi:UDP-glucose:(heptosyl)LPS alpha-1,3-glucosyltransferase
VDGDKFNPQRRKELREKARAELQLTDDVFAILFIGNDWGNRGLPCLLEAVAMMQDPRARVLVVGRDSTGGYQERVERLGLSGRILFLPVRRDVEFYYAAADAYAGPSLEDTFSLPPAEAMACGLPVITSRATGVAEIVHDKEDGMVLENPADSKTLSEWLVRLASDMGWREKLGRAAAVTAAKYTWAQNAEELRALIDAALESRNARG